MNCKFHILGLVLFIILFIKNTQSVSCVYTKSGPIKGFVLKKGNYFLSIFKNVPYARQPVNDLRFQLPKPVKVWDSEDTLNYSKNICCPQADFGQEDCLVLDIYSRKKKTFKNSTMNSANTIPVLIYFHAGRFSHGCKEDYNSEYLLEYNDIIVVIPNYRLGILGFLSYEDTSLPGNLGLWDQRMAMKWVYDNIEAFGGDRTRITIAGHGAGGVSVGFHILSQDSHRYFSAAISGSGTAFDPWVMTKNTSTNAKIVAEKLQCPSNSSENLITCLQTCQLSAILKTQGELRNTEFLPVIDKKAEHPFLPLHPETLYQKGYQKKVRYMAGVTQAKELFEINNKFPEAKKTQHLDSIIQHLLGPYMQHMTNLPLIIKVIKYHYLRGVDIPTFDSIKPQVTAMMFDFMYNNPLHKALMWHSRKEANTYMYVFNSEDNDKSNYSYSYDQAGHFGVEHMEDVYYIFNTKLPKRLPQHDPRVKARKRIFCRIWGNFIQSRFATPYPSWEVFSAKNKNYAEISETVHARVNYRQSEIEFWMLLVPDLMNIQNPNKMVVPLKQIKSLNSTAWGSAGLAILLGVLCIAVVGAVKITRKKVNHSSIIPLTSPREETKYSAIG